MEDAFSSGGRSSGGHPSSAEDNSVEDVWKQRRTFSYSGGRFVLDALEVFSDIVKDGVHSTDHYCSLHTRGSPYVAVWFSAHINNFMDIVIPKTLSID